MTVIDTLTCQKCNTKPSLNNNAGARQSGLCTCLCGDFSVSESYHYESGISSDEYKQYLMESLNAGPDACALPDNFFDMICTYWEIYQNLACGSNDLRYLYTRSAAITALMGCAIFDVTTRTSISESNNRSESIGKSDSLSQGHSTSHNSSYNDSVFESAYSDFANSLLRASSQRSAESNSLDTSRTITDDISHGASDSLTEAERDSKSDRFSHDESESTLRASNTGARRGSDYSFTHDATDSNAFYVIIGGVTRTGTKGANIHLMRADTFNASSSQRQGTSTKDLSATAYSQSWSQRLSSSFFQTVLDSNTNARSNAVAFDYSSSQSDGESHSSGKGQSSGESEARSTSSSQRTNQNESLATSETDGSGSAYSITEYRANSQKFEHLAKLLNNTNQAIQEFLTYRAAATGVGIAKLLMANPDGSCNLDAIRHRLRYPGGVNGINCYPQNTKGIRYAQQ